MRLHPGDMVKLVSLKPWLTESDITFHPLYSYWDVPHPGSANAGVVHSRDVCLVLKYVHETNGTMILVGDKLGWISAHSVELIMTMKASK